MNFDDTELVICQRSNADLFDMTLRVWEKYNWRLLTKYLWGCIPFTILNVGLLGWMISSDGLISGELLDYSQFQSRSRYFFDHAMLVFLELPLAGLFATAYLGEVTFRQDPSARQLIRSVLKRCGGVLVVLGVLRFGLIGPILMLFLPRYGKYDPFIELFLLGIMATGLSLLTRTFRPYAPEIVVLERCDLKQKDKSQPSYAKRSNWLHVPVSSECFVRMSLLFLINSAGISALLLAYLFLQGVTSSNWQWGWIVDWIVLPIAFWTLGAFATVFRFLCYLDSRIALEGWEVELLMRAEANRLQQSQAGGMA